MSKRAEQRFACTLFMDNPLHAKAWHALSGIQKGKRTEYICKKIIGDDSDKELARIVYTNTLKALENYGVEFNGPETTKTIKDNKAEEIEQNFFGFISSLIQEGG